jgi:DNA-binding response OmpR family regulator
VTLQLSQGRSALAQSARQLNSVGMELEPSTKLLSRTRDPVFVVLIENDLRFAWTCKLALEEAGLEVLIADDGRGGLKLAASVLPDVIVLDLGLPDMPGSQVLARLKSRKETSCIPVVTLANDSSKTSVQICRMLGAVDQMTKSSRSPVLLAQQLLALTTDSGQT